MNIGKYSIELQNNGDHKVSYLEAGERITVTINNLEELFAGIVQWYSMRATEFAGLFHMALHESDRFLADPTGKAMIQALTEEETRVVQGSVHDFYLRQLLTAYNRVNNLSLMETDVRRYIRS